MSDVSYDAAKAVAYAEKWWNDYNPMFPRFSVDCTNYVSQCLLAGGFVMHGYPVQDNGWWCMHDQWSFSWSVSHSLRWYLSSSTLRIPVTIVSSAQALYPGDIICYDFQGDNRWDHMTIVVAKDERGMPLVNAHTDNSWHRYYAYKDSAAWTPNIRYLFFQIGNRKEVEH